MRYGSDMRLGLGVTLLAAALVGCADDLSADSYMDPDLPPYGCDSEPTGPCGESTSAGEAAGACQGSSDCADTQICAADFDGEIGTFQCQSTCIGEADDQSWCFDDAACCDPDAVCTRGYCISSGAPATTSGADSSGTDATTAAADSTSSGESSTGDASTGGTTTSGGSSG